MMKRSKTSASVASVPLLRNSNPESWTLPLISHWVRFIVKSYSNVGVWTWLHLSVSVDLAAVSAAEQELPSAVSWLHNSHLLAYLMEHLWSNSNSLETQRERASESATGSHSLHPPPPPPLVPCNPEGLFTVKSELPFPDFLRKRFARFLFKRMESEWTARMCCARRALCVFGFGNSGWYWPLLKWLFQ